MFGYLIWHGEGKTRAVLERRAIGGAWFLVLEVWGDQRRLSRRVRRGLRAMEDRGVRRWVMDPAWPEKWRTDVAEVDECALRRALLPRLLDCLIREGLQLDGAAVELTASRADEAVRHAAAVLSRRCRYLRLRMDGAAELEAELLRRYGIASGGAAPVALEICFDRPVSGAPVLLLGAGCGKAQKAVYAIPGRVTEGLRPYALTPQLVAALWECGAVKTGDIRLKSLDFHA